MWANLSMGEIGKPLLSCYVLTPERPAPQAPHPSIHVKVIGCLFVTSPKELARKTTGKGRMAKDTWRQPSEVICLLYLTKISEFFLDSLEFSFWEKAEIDCTSWRSTPSPRSRYQIRLPWSSVPTGRTFDISFQIITEFFFLREQAKLNSLAILIELI